MSETASENTPANKSGSENAVTAVHDGDSYALHTSLAGMTLITICLLIGMGLPVFGMQPMTSVLAYIVLVVTAAAGIAGMYYFNLRMHADVQDHARLTRVLVDSLKQGFFSFDKDGVCGDVFSHACIDLLECAPAGKMIADVLKVPERELTDFRDWMDILFMPNHALGFDDVVKFLPRRYPHTAGHIVALDYSPIRNNEGVLTNIEVIATDQTEEHEAQQRTQQQQNYASMITRIFRERNQFLATITHIRTFLADAGKVESRDDAAPILRLLHTLKAAVKHYYLLELSATIHALESDLRSTSIETDEQFIKILLAGSEKVNGELQAVINQVNEIVGHDYERRGDMREIADGAIYDFALRMQQLGATPALVQEYLRVIAAVPVRDCFRVFERELQDLATIMGKQIKPVKFIGDNPPVLMVSLRNLFFTFTHLCRNIIDHGIEPPITRLARGKDPLGLVTVSTDVIRLPSGEEQLRMIISDDGNGIDPGRIRSKLMEKDPQGSWHDEDDAQVIQRIFSWGFSTRDNVTDISGRGVGLEAVQREVALLGGTIRVSSEIFKGTHFEILLPYRLAIGSLDQASAATGDVTAKSVK